MSTLRITWQADHDPTSVVLASPDGTFGVRRVDNHVAVVENGTPLTNAGGVYSYSFDEVSGANEYEAYIKIIDRRNTYYIHRFVKSRLGVNPSLDSIDNAADVVLSVLIELGLASDYALYDPKDKSSVRNWPGVVGGMQSDPDEMMALYDSGGVIDGIVQMGEGPAIIEHCDVQIRCRGKRGAYTATKRVARRIKDTLIRTKNYDVSVSSEIQNEPPEMYRLSASTPLGKELYMGLDDRGRPSFAVNVRTSIKRLRT